ncbi:MAG: hypothetical protein QGG71_24240 [Pirellulaceae bacterium]|jgi:hypothetical protein|nr:hypothetical protein [Pirellulaceae bacterium]
MYALLTGELLIESNSLPELVHTVREAELWEPKEFQLSVNELFQNAVLEMITKRPEDRFQDPSELLRELGRIGKYNNLEAD